MLKPVRKTLLVLGAFGAIAFGASALAGAASKTTTTPSSSSSSSSARADRPRHEQLTGATADKVKAAALDKVPGATVLRAESGGPDGSAYHAHVRKSDGTEVTVLVDADFKATSVQTRRARGHGGRGHRGGPGGRSAQKALTGATAAKVKAAALDRVSGGTVLRVESGGHDGSAYHAHVRRSDGTEVVVLVNKQFEVTAVDEMRHR